MAGWITAAVGTVALVVAWVMYRRFSQKEQEARQSRRKRRNPAAREAPKGDAPEGEQEAAAPEGGDDKPEA